MDLLTALLNSWAALAKQRPVILQTLVPALRSWTPVTLEKLSTFAVKSVEKALRILLVHINRWVLRVILKILIELHHSNYVPPNSPLSMQLNDTLNMQAQRMEAAAREDRQRREGRKRAASAPAGEPSDAKRPKIDSESTVDITSTLAAFDFTSLPPSLITDLIIANLEAFTESALESLVQQYRRNYGTSKITSQPSAPTPPISTSSSSALPPKVPTGPRSLMVQQAADRSSTPPARTTPPVVKAEEPVDPLQMDIDQDELEFEPETLNAQVDCYMSLCVLLTRTLQLSGNETVVEEEQPTADFEFDSLQAFEFKLPPPKDLPEQDRILLITDSVGRIWAEADDLPVDSSQAGGTSPNEVWMLLLVRMITRVAQIPADESLEEDNKEMTVYNFYVRQDQLRQKLCDFIMANFSSRFG